MNLYGAATYAIQALNVSISAQWSASTGFSTAADGTPTPGYAAEAAITVQRQETSFKDLKQIDGLNMQGIFAVVYSKTSLNGVDRVNQLGGDKLVFDGATWLVVVVTERWPGWCRAIVCKQVNP